MSFSNDSFNLLSLSLPLPLCRCFLQLWSLFHHHSTLDTNILLACLPVDLQSIVHNGTFNDQKKVSTPLVILYRNILHINPAVESVVSVYTKSMFTTHDLVEWMVRNIHGLIAQRTPESELTVHRPSAIGTSVVIYHSKYPGEPDEQSNMKTRELRDSLIPIAKIHWNIFFSIASFHAFKDTLLHEYKLSVERESSLSTVMMVPVVVYDSLGIPFLMNSSYSLDNMNHFIEQFKAGDVESSLRVNSASRTKQIISRVNRYSHVKYITHENIHQAMTFQRKPIVLTLFRWIDDTKLIDLLQSLSQLAKSLSSASTASHVIVSTLNVDQFTRVPFELRFQCTKPVHLLLVEKDDRFLWKDIIRFKGDLKQGVDSLVAFTRDQVKRFSLKITRGEVLINANVSRKQLDTQRKMKSEL